MASEGAFVTLSRCRLLKLFREDFHRLETTHPDIAQHIRTTAARRRAMRKAAVMPG
jgi:CRP-like cAMP-binding protein